MKLGRDYKTKNRAKPEDFLLSLWAGEGIRLRCGEAIRLAKQTFPDLYRVTDETITKWIVRLHEKGFLERESEGRSVYYSLNSVGYDRALKGMLTEFIKSSELNSNIIEWPFYLFSDTNLGDFLKEDSIEKIKDTLDDLQFKFNELMSIVVCDYREYYQVKNFSQVDIEKIDFYEKKIGWYRDLKSRYITSDVAGSPQQNEKIIKKELGTPPSHSRFHKLMRNLPLTFDEFKEFIEIENKMKEFYPLFRKYSHFSEKTAPKICMMTFNWEYEEERVKESPFLIRAGPDNKIMLIDEALDTLTKKELENYRDSMKAFLKDPWGNPDRINPEWPGEDENMPILPSLEEWREDENTPPHGLEWEIWGNKILKRIKLKLLSSSKRENMQKKEPNIMNLTVGEALKSRGVDGTRAFINQFCPECLGRVERWDGDLVCSGCGRVLTKVGRSQSTN